MKKIEPIVKDEEGKIVQINLCCDGANADWLRAARLKKKSEDGDEETKKELAELESTSMYVMNEGD